jgi:hypothetical protein
MRLVIALVVAVAVVACSVGGAHAYPVSVLAGNFSDCNIVNNQPATLEMGACVPGSLGAIRVNCTSQTTASAWTATIFSDTGCTAQMGQWSSVGTTCFTALPRVLYFRIDCNPPALTSTGGGGGGGGGMMSSTGTVVPPVTPTADCTSRHATLCRGGSSCTTGDCGQLITPSGTCTQNQYGYARLVCQSGTANSAWTVSQYIDSSCSGTTLLTKSGTGTGCVSQSTIVGNVYMSVDCSLPASCPGAGGITDESSTGGGGGGGGGAVVPPVAGNTGNQGNQGNQGNTGNPNTGGAAAPVDGPDRSTGVSGGYPYLPNHSGASITTAVSGAALLAAGVVLLRFLRV